MRLLQEPQIAVAKESMLFAQGLGKEVCKGESEVFMSQDQRLPPVDTGQTEGIEKESGGFVRRMKEFFCGKKLSAGTKPPSSEKIAAVSLPIIGDREKTPADGELRISSHRLSLSKKPVPEGTVVPHPACEEVRTFTAALGTGNKKLALNSEDKLVTVSRSLVADKEVSKQAVEKLLALLSEAYEEAKNDPEAVRTLQENMELLKENEWFKDFREKNKDLEQRFLQFSSAVATDELERGDRRKIMTAIQDGNLSEQSIPKDRVRLAKAACYAYKYVTEHPADEKAKQVLLRLYVELEDRKLVDGLLSEPVTARWSADEALAFKALVDEVKHYDIKAAREQLEQKRAPKFRMSVLGESYWHARGQVEEINQIIGKLEKEFPRNDDLIIKLRQIVIQLSAYTSAVEEKLPELKSKSKDDKDRMAFFGGAKSLGGESSKAGVELLQAVDTCVKEVCEPLKSIHSLKGKVKDPTLQAKIGVLAVQIPTRFSLIAKDTEKFPNALEAQGVVQSISGKVAAYNEEIRKIDTALGHIS